MKQFLRAKPLKITEMREARQDTKDGSTLHIELDLGNTGITYKTASNLSIIPKNRSDDVQEIANALGLHGSLNDYLKVAPAPGKTAAKYPCPQSIKVKDYLSRSDFKGVVSKKMLRGIIPYCNDETSRKELEFLVSP